MKKCLSAAAVLALLFLSGCAERTAVPKQAPTEEKPVKETEKKKGHSDTKEAGMIAKINRFLDEFQLPSKLAPNLEFGTIGVALGVDGGLMASADYSSPYSELTITAVPSPVAEHDQPVYKITGSSTDTGWEGFKASFIMEGLKYKVDFVADDDFHITGKEFKDMLESFSKDKTACGICKLDSDKIMSRYSVANSFKKKLAMDAEVLSPVYTLNGEDFTLTFSNEILDSPPTARNIVEDDIKTVGETKQFADQLELPADWFGQTVQLNEITIMNYSKANFAITLMNDKEEYVVLEIGEEADDQLADDREAAYKTADLEAGEIKGELLYLDTEQVARFKHNGLYYKLAYRSYYEGKKQTKASFVRTINSLSKENPYKKYWDVDSKSIARDFAIYAEADTPPDVAIILFENDKAIQRSVDVSRDIYSLSRYYEAVTPK